MSCPVAEKRTKGPFQIREREEDKYCTSYQEAVMRTNTLRTERDCNCLVTTSGDLPHRGEAAVELITNAPEFVVRAPCIDPDSYLNGTYALSASHDQATPPV